jgi:hypothetical protein
MPVAQPILTHAVQPTLTVEQACPPHNKNNNRQKLGLSLAKSPAMQRQFFSNGKFIDMFFIYKKHNNSKGKERQGSPYYPTAPC